MNWLLIDISSKLLFLLLLPLSSLTGETTRVDGSNCHTVAGVELWYSNGGSEDISPLSSWLTL